MTFCSRPSANALIAASHAPDVPTERLVQRALRTVLHQGLNGQSAASGIIELLDTETTAPAAASGVIGVLTPQWRGVVLVKPQFEAGREHVGKGGIVRDPEAQQMAVSRVENAVVELGGEAVALIDSPILGMEGNREFLLRARF